MPSAQAAPSLLKPILGFSAQTGFPSPGVCLPRPTFWEDRREAIPCSERRSLGRPCMCVPPHGLRQTALSPVLQSSPWSLQSPQVLLTPCSLQQESGGGRARRAQVVRSRKVREEAAVLMALVPACRSRRRVSARPPRRPSCPCAPAPASSAAWMTAAGSPSQSRSSPCGPRRAFTMAGRSCRWGPVMQLSQQRRLGGSMGGAAAHEGGWTENLADTSPIEGRAIILTLYFLISICRTS